MKETCDFSSESYGIYDGMVTWLWRIKTQLMLLEALQEASKIIARLGPVLQVWLIRIIEYFRAEAQGVSVLGMSSDL